MESNMRLIKKQITPSLSHETGQIIIFHPPGKSAGDLFGMVKTWPFQRLSDLELGDQKVSEKTKRPKLVGGFNPFEKYARQIASFPQFSGWKQTNNWKTTS